MRHLSFKRHRLPPAIIRHSIWLYARFTLSFRDVEEMLAERGLNVSYETVRRWFLKIGTAVAASLRRTRPRSSDHGHIDEMVIVSSGSAIGSGAPWIMKAKFWISSSKADATPNPLKS